MSPSLTIKVLTKIKPLISSLRVQLDKERWTEKHQKEDKKEGKTKYKEGMKEEEIDVIHCDTQQKNAVQSWKNVHLGDIRLKPDSSHS